MNGPGPRRYWLHPDGAEVVAEGNENGHYDIAFRGLTPETVAAMATGDQARDYMAVYRAMFSRGFIRVIERGMRVDLDARAANDEEIGFDQLTGAQKDYVRDLKAQEKLVIFNAEQLAETREGSGNAGDYSVIAD